MKMNMRLQNIKAIIVDDESFNRMQLKLKLARLYPEISVVAECIDGMEGLRAIELYKPDLVFLDVMMPVMDGITMLEHISCPDFEVIFISVSEKFAIQAIRMSALDYLVKPFKTEELQSAIERFKEKRNFDTPERLKNLLHNVHAGNNDQKLALNTANGIRFIPIDEIMHCQAQGSYTCIYLSNGKTELASRALHDFEEILSERQFIRIHKSHLVNKKFIDSINKTGCVILKGNKMLEISRRKLVEVKEKLSGIKLN